MPQIEDRPLRTAAEEQEEEAAERVVREDVAPPQPERVRQADEEERRPGAGRRTRCLPRAAARSIWIAKPTPKSAAKIVMNLPLTSQSTSAWAIRSGIQVHINSAGCRRRAAR